MTLSSLALKFEYCFVDTADAADAAAAIVATAATLPPSLSVSLVMS